MESTMTYYVPVKRAEKRCLGCDSLFIGEERKLFCSRDCGARHRSSKRWVAKTHNLICRYCRVSFTTNHKKKYCSSECMHKAHNVGTIVKLCQSCGIEFNAISKSNKNCSRECYKQIEASRYKKKRYLLKSSQYEHINKLLVFELHNWHCAKCGIETPKALMGSFKPNEPTLDHIIPISKGGTHTKNNVQLLCRYCNCVVKNNKL